MARLVQNETGAFLPVPASATLDGIAVAQLPVVNGNATAIWEVLEPGLLFDFGIWVQSGQAGGTANFAASLGPAPPAFDAISGGSASATLPIPRFVDADTVAPLFYTNACAVLAPTSTTLSVTPTGIPSPVHVDREGDDSLARHLRSAHGKRGLLRQWSPDTRQFQCPRRRGDGLLPHQSAGRIAPPHRPIHAGQPAILYAERFTRDGDFRHRACQFVSRTHQQQQSFPSRTSRDVHRPRGRRPRDRHRAIHRWSAIARHRHHVRWTRKCPRHVSPPPVSTRSSPSMAAMAATPNPPAASCRPSRAPRALSASLRHGCGGAGQAVTFTATLASSAPSSVPAATGTVQFVEGQAVLGTARSPRVRRASRSRRWLPARTRSSRSTAATRTGTACIPRQSR